MHREKVSRPPGEWSVALTTSPDTPMPDFNYLVMDSDEEVLNTSQNILYDEESKFYRQDINRPNADLWHSAIEAGIDALQHNHTWDVADRATFRMIVDSK
jgi:hypothetical protein